MRAGVALLLLANLGWFALAQGWLQPYVGLSTQHEREPQRMAAQLNAASVRVLGADEAAAAARAAACARAEAGELATPGDGPGACATPR